MSRALYFSTHWIGDWLGSRTTPPSPNPARPVRSQSLHGLRYHLMLLTINNKLEQFKTELSPSIPYKQRTTPWNRTCQVLYLRLHLDRRLAWCKHFRTSETTGNYPHHNVLLTFEQVKILHRQQNSDIWSITQINLDLRNTNLGYGFHQKHWNPRTLITQSFARDSEGIFVST
jgi:hypothetical protein